MSGKYPVDVYLIEAWYQRVCAFNEAISLGARTAKPKTKREREAVALWLAARFDTHVAPTGQQTLP